MAQHQQLDVLGGGWLAHQQDQTEHLLEDQIHTTCGVRRSLLVSGMRPVLEPHRSSAR
jgi:hypothetical protein